MTKFRRQLASLLLFFCCMHPTTASAAYTKEYLMSIGEYQMTASDIIDMADGYRFPQEFHHGRVEYPLPTVGQSVAVGILLGLITGNPFVGVGTALGIALISYIAEDLLPIRYYQLIFRVETFPTDVPTAYQGAVMRVTYEYTLYPTTNLTAENRIGEPVRGVYYGMGY